MLAQVFGRGGWISYWQLLGLVAIIALIVVYKVVKNKG